MYFSSLNIYSRQGPAWAEVFTFAASQTTVLVNRRYEIARCGVCHNFYCIGRADFEAVAAVCALRRQTVLLNHHGVTDTYRCLFGRGYLLYCSGRTHLRAACALGSAVAVVETHPGLHECIQLLRRDQHAVGAFGHTELA